MKLFSIHPNDDGTRRWKGRRQGCTIIIFEIMNKELGHVDKYGYELIKGTVMLQYNSVENNRTYPTIESCKNAATKHFDKYMEMVYANSKNYKKYLKEVRKIDAGEARKDQGHSS